MNHLRTKTADKKADINPKNIISIFDHVMSGRFLRRSYKLAEAIVGIAKKNENSVATFLFKPSKSPPIIVAPDLDTPGIIARHCINPILKALSGVISSSSSTVDSLGFLSIIIINNPPTINAIAITKLEKKNRFITL